MTKEKVIVDEIYMRSNNKTTPVLIKFQNGELKTANKDTTLYIPAKRKPEKQDHTIVVTSGNIYSGPVAEADKKLVDTYICVRNKETGKIRIIAIDQVNLINHVYEDKVKTQYNVLSKETAFETAMRNFGGRKELRYLNNRERDKINIDVFRDQLDNTVEKSKVEASTVEEVQTTEDIADRIRPACNKNATNLHAVYSVTDVIPLDLLDRLDEEVTALFNTELDDIPIQSEFLKKTIASLRISNTQSTQTILKMKMIIYMDGLLKLVKSKLKNLNRVELSKITEKVETDIRQRFSAENEIQNFRSSTTNEKAICYFLVLAFLISSNFELDVDMLTTELSVSKANILKYAHLVNAVHKPKSNSLVLKLPSQYTPMKMAFKGKRKKSNK